MLAGSTNQRIRYLSALGRKRYSKEERAKVLGKRFQIEIDADHRMWGVGIPERRDLQLMRHILSERGILVDDVSWRSEV